MIEINIVNFEMKLLNYSAVEQAYRTHLNKVIGNLKEDSHVFTGSLNLNVENLLVSHFLK